MPGTVVDKAVEPQGRKRVAQGAGRCGKIGENAAEPPIYDFFTPSSPWDSGRRRTNSAPEGVVRAMLQIETYRA